MPRFYFDVHDGTVTIDDEGTELPDIDEARIQATKLAGILLSDNAEQFWNGEEWKVSVRDENGVRLFSLLFVAMNTPVAPPPPALHARA